jgi:hypothetical protein
MRMFLIVKGNRSYAEFQAHRRGIAIEIDAESDDGNETYCYAPMIDRPKIVEWYCEDRGIARVALRGECLWYSERDDV